MKTCQLCGGPNAMEIKLAEVVPAVICATCLMSASPRKLADRVVTKTHELGPDKLRTAGLPATVTSSAKGHEPGEFHENVSPRR